MTEIKIGFLPPDLTLVQSELVVLGVLGYSRTQQAEFNDEGILSVSGHCHLGIVCLGKYKILYSAITDQGWRVDMPGLII